MKGLIRIIGLLILLLLAMLILDIWYLIFVLPFVFMFLFSHKPWRAFIGAFLSGFLAWGFFALKTYLSGGELIAGRVAELLSKGALPGQLLVLVVAVLAGLFAGFSGASGAAFRSVFKKKKSSYY